MISLPNPTKMITTMETFKVILSLQSNPDKFTFTTVEECTDMDECIEFIHDHFPLHNIESIRRIPNWIMTLKPEQLQFFKENYASVIVDEMEENDALIEYAIRKIAEEMKEMTEEEVYDSIVEVYDEETASDQYRIAKLYSNKKWWLCMISLLVMAPLS